MTLNSILGVNNNKNRRRLDIVRDMLSVTLVRSKKTKIMYQASLSYRQVEKYLKALLKSGLVEYDGDYGYLITCKGKKFLQMHSYYLELCRQIGEDIDVARKDKALLENMCFNNKRNSE